MRTHWLGWLVVVGIAGAARAETLTPPVVPGALDPADLRSLTNDPVLGKASRVRGTEAAGMVTFTFDDGPHPDTTPAVIAALEEFDVPATFFVVTRQLDDTLGAAEGAAGRALLDRLLAAGFEIGSHSVSHANLRKASAKALALEIDGSIRTLAPLANRAIGLFRPPFGAFSPAGRKRLHRLGLTEVRWSIDPRDWDATDATTLRTATVAAIVRRNGGVVLLHDVEPITAEVIGDILDDLERENCQRLATRRPPILPVSIHYFLKDGARRRPVPEAVQRRTEAYRAALPERCQRRRRRPPVTIPVPGFTPADARKLW